MPTFHRTVATGRTQTLAAGELAILEVVSDDHELLELFRTAHAIADRRALKKMIEERVVAKYGSRFFKLFKCRDGIQLVNQCHGQQERTTREIRFSSIQAIRNERAKITHQHRNRKVRLLDAIGLTWSDKAREDYEAGLKREQVRPFRRADIYPQLGKWIVENDEIDGKWRHYLETQELPDKRRKRCKVFRIDLNQLQYDVGPEESILFYDGDDFVMGVFRHLTHNRALLRYMDNIIRDTVEERRSIRLEDPGKLVLVGYSAGSRSSPSFGWARNTQRSRGQADVDAENITASHCLALVYELFRKKLPKHVMDDLDRWIDSSGIPRMILKSEDENNDIKVSIGGELFTFHNISCAPPTAVMAVNYSRVVHYEYQPHTYAMSLTVHRSDVTEAGGHFYNSRYRIRVQAAADTAVVWNPRHEHGTSLQLFDPYTTVIPDFKQTGLAFVTSSRITSVWKKYQQNEINAREAALQCFTDTDSACDSFECPGPIINSDGEEEYAVERILASEHHKGLWIYLVRWKGWPPAYDDWLSRRDLEPTAALEVWLKSHPEEAIVPSKGRRSRKGRPAGVGHHEVGHLKAADA